MKNQKEDNQYNMRLNKKVRLKEKNQLGKFREDHLLRKFKQINNNKFFKIIILTLPEEVQNLYRIN